MYTSFNSSFNKQTTYLYPGEYYSSYEDIMISTLLGSCVAVVLYDKKNGLSGMNHFMLPSSISEEFFLSKSGKYGMYAMELLINSLMKNGAEKKELVAKVFGGASVLKTSTNHKIGVAQNNIDFAFNFLKTEGIKVISSDTGGIEARKIFLYAINGKVMMKRIASTMIEDLRKKENDYLKKIKSKYD